MPRLPPSALYLALPLLLAACGQPDAGPPAPRPVLVQAAAPSGQTATVYTGEVRARHETDLAFRVGGKLVARLVDAGARVERGTALARLDPADLELAARSARAQVASAESELATAEAEQGRYADLLAKRFVSQAAYDAKNHAFRAARARLDQALAQAAVSGNQAGYGTLVADQAGVVTGVLAEAGQVVAAGQPVLRLARPDELEVAIAVPESRLAEVKANPAFTIGLWARPELQFRGSLRELSPAADPATRTYAARIRIAEPGPEVQIGMTARVALGGSVPGGAIVVPLTAVVDQGQGPAVWIVEGGKVKRRPVQVVRFREDGAELAGGVQPGEQVVVAGGLKLVPDQAVTPQTATPPEQQK